MTDFYVSLFEPKASVVRKVPLFLVESQDERRSEIKMVVESSRKEENIKNEDLFTPFRFFLRFGRFIGVIPVGGLMGNSSENLYFKWKSFHALSGVIVILILSVNVSIGIINFFGQQKRTAGDVAGSSTMAIFYSTGLFLYLYILLYGNDFIRLFKKWRDLKSLHFSNDQGDVQLSFHVNLIAGCIFASAILENALLFILQSRIIPSSRDDTIYSSILEAYYKKSHTEWSRLYNDTTGSSILGVFVFVSNKLALYSWNFADILIILFSRALYFKFQKLNAIAELRLMVGNVASHDPEEWKALTHDHATLCDLLKEFDRFLSPIIFGCYTSNIFFVCWQIKMGITPRPSENNLVQALYTVWSFIHLILRVFLVTVSAARINDHAHMTRFLLQLCPPEAYSLEVQRAELRLGTSVIGLTGLRCFVITKPFLLTLVGVIFTMEIVLLQTL